MKRYLILTICMLCGLLGATARPLKEPKKGYRGFIEISPTISFKKYLQSDMAMTPMNDLLGYASFETTHGYQINNHWFTGAGVAVAILDGCSVHLDGRYDMKFGKATPYADLKLIYYIFGDVEARIGLAPTIGYRFNFGYKGGINIGVGLTCRKMYVTTGHEAPWPDDLQHTYPYEKYYEITSSGKKIVPLFHLTIGFDF